MRTLIRLSFLAFAVANAPILMADPVAEVLSFSLFKEVDLPKLAKGDVAVASGPVMKFPRGLEVQSLFVLPMPVRKADELLRRWNGARYSELKVYQHVDLPGRPSVGDFQKIGSAPNNSAVRAFISATQKLNPERPELQMSVAEAKRAPGPEEAPRGTMPPGVAAFWSSLLNGRVSAFLSGGLSAQPAYFLDGKSIRASDDAGELLKERSSIRKQFSGLTGTMLGGSQGGANPALFYEMFDVEGRAALSLGAIYSRGAGDGVQSGTLQFYSSDGLLVMLSLGQLWPVDVGGKPATLVWRGDLIASSQLGELRGIERAGAAVAMRKVIQKNVNTMRKDLSSQR
jgi:hypothetical protein